MCTRKVICGVTDVLRFICNANTVKCRYTNNSKKVDEDRINAFEMKNLRKLLRVRRTEKKTNEWVLDKTGTHRQLLANVKVRKMTYFGHILRKKHVCLEKDLIQGTLPGGRRREKPITSWLGNLTSWTTMNMDEMLRSTEDRTGWQQLVRSVTNPRIEDG